MKTKQETNQLLQSIASYIVSQADYKRKPVQFNDVAKACHTNIKNLTEKPEVRQSICRKLLENNRVLDVDVCPFEQEFSIMFR